MRAPRKALAVLMGALCVFILAMLWLVIDHPRPADQPPPDRSASKIAARPGAAAAFTPDRARTRSLPANPAGLVLLPEAASLARTLNASDGTAEQDVQTLSSLVDLFRRANQGAVPSGGLNEEITAAMLGQNPRHFAVLPKDCPGLGSAGELRDRWGTPYFFHPFSREILGIRSAGPDQKLWTADDVLIGEEAGAEVRR